MLHFVEEVDFGLYSCGYGAPNRYFRGKQLRRSSQKIELSGEIVVCLARGNLLVGFRENSID
jgi:hypothetical protein